MDAKAVDSFRMKSGQKMRIGQNFMDARPLKSKVKLPSLGANMYIITTSTRLVNKAWFQLIIFTSTSSSAYYPNLSEKWLLNHSLQSVSTNWYRTKLSSSPSSSSHLTLSIVVCFLCHFYINSSGHFSFWKSVDLDECKGLKESVGLPFGLLSVEALIVGCFDW